jgi:hypothetical protein
MQRFLEPLFTMSRIHVTARDASPVDTGCKRFAEGVGFEPTMRLSPHSGFQDCLRACRQCPGSPGITGVCARLVLPVTVACQPRARSTRVEGDPLDQQHQCRWTKCGQSRCTAMAATSSRSYARQPIDRCRPEHRRRGRRQSNNRSDRRSPTVHHRRGDAVPHGSTNGQTGRSADGS